MKFSPFLEKYQKELVLGLFIFLITALSFGLGYITASEITQTVPIIFEKCSTQ